MPSSRSIALLGAPVAPVIKGYYERLPMFGTGRNIIGLGYPNIPMLARSQVYPELVWGDGALSCDARYPRPEDIRHCVYRRGERI